MREGECHRPAFDVPPQQLRTMQKVADLADRRFPPMGSKARVRNLPQAEQLFRLRVRSRRNVDFLSAPLQLGDDGSEERNMRRVVEIKPDHWLQVHALRYLFEHRVHRDTMLTPWQRRCVKTAD